MHVPFEKRSCYNCAHLSLCYVRIGVNSAMLPLKGWGSQIIQVSKTKDHPYDFQGVIEALARACLSYDPNPEELAVQYPS